jgi:hypothetical protein
MDEDRAIDTTPTNLKKNNRRPARQKVLTSPREPSLKKPGQLVNPRETVSKGSEKKQSYDRVHNGLKKELAEAKDAIFYLVKKIQLLEKAQEKCTCQISGHFNKK